MNSRLSFLVVLCLSFIVIHGVVININERSKSTDSNSEESIESGDNEVLRNLKSIDKRMNRILASIKGEGDEVFFQGCPDGWVSFNVSCYLFDSDKLNLVAAQAYCQQRSSHLVSVETTDENEFLKIFMKTIEGEQKSASYWLGITKNTTSKSWFWEGDNTKATFFDWGPGEPDEKIFERCVWFEQIKGYRWSDVDCGRTTRPVCEKRKTTMD